MADRTILNPQYANDLNGLFNGSGTIDTGNITASTIALNNGGGNIDIGVVGDVGETTYDTPGTLTITRNVSNGQNEFDFVAINQTTGNGMYFYVSETEVNNASLPSLTVTTAGTTTNGVISTTGTGGNIDIGVVGDVGETTYDAPGTLTITRNVSNGQNEFDFVAINQTTGNGMYFYVSETEVNNASLPSLTVTTAGTTTNGVISTTGTGGNIDIGVVGDVGETTYDTDGTLTITRNLSNGQNEFDFIAINSTTGNGMYFYVSETEANNESIPSLTVSTVGISAPTYTGGIGAYYGSLTPSTINPQSVYTNPSVTIPGFVGLDTWAYIINGNTSLPIIIWTIDFVSSDAAANTTTFSISLFNAATTGSYGSPSPFSIIAMAPSV
jgi:hypothetical protein